MYSSDMIISPLPLIFQLRSYIFREQNTLVEEPNLKELVAKSQPSVKNNTSRLYSVFKKYFVQDYKTTFFFSQEYTFLKISIEICTFIKFSGNTL